MEPSKLNDFGQFSEFIQAHIAGYQNLSADEKAQLFALMKQYGDTDWSPPLKSAAISYALLNVGGTRYFKDLTSRLR